MTLNNRDNQDNWIESCLNILFIVIISVLVLVVSPRIPYFNFLLFLMSMHYTTSKNRKQLLL